MSRPAARVSRDPDAIKGDHDLLDSRSAVTTTRRPTKDPVEDQAAAARAAAVEAEHEQRRAPSGPRATVRDDAQVRAQETKVLQAFTDVWLLPVQDRRPAGDASRAEAARLRAAPAASCSGAGGDRPVGLRRAGTHPLPPPGAAPGSVPLIVRATAR